MSEKNIYIESDMSDFKAKVGWIGVVVEFKCKTRSGKDYIETREIFERHHASINQILLIAITKGLQALKPCEVTIYMDQGFIANMISRGMPQKWADSNWMNAKGVPVANAYEWQQLIPLLENHKVTFAIDKQHSYTDWILSKIKEKQEGK